MLIILCMGRMEYSRSTIPTTSLKGISTTTNKSTHSQIFKINFGRFFLLLWVFLNSGAVFMNYLVRQQVIHKRHKTQETQDTKKRDNRHKRHRTQKKRRKRHKIHKKQKRQKRNKKQKRHKIQETQTICPC